MDDDISAVESQAKDPKGEPIPGTLLNDDGTVTVTLKYPIKVVNEQRTSLTLRRPHIKELKGMDAARGNVSSIAAIIGSLAAIPPSSVDMIDVADFLVLGDVIGGFSGRRPETGAN